MALFTDEQERLIRFADGYNALTKARSFSADDYIRHRMFAGKPAHVPRRTIASLVLRGLLAHPIVDGVEDDKRYVVTHDLVDILIRRIERDEAAYRRGLREAGIEGEPI